MFDFLKLISGLKTYAAGVLAIVTGLGMVCTGAAGLIAHYAVPDSPAFLDVQTATDLLTNGFTTIAGGLAVIGIGHKLEKSVEATKAGTEATQEVGEEISQVSDDVADVQASVDKTKKR